jgi:prepilin-type N-terminal cleavage/methylation domain-containing protein
MTEADLSDLNHGRRMMRHRVRARLDSERGFTLIEVLVVIIIIGILAGVALAVFLNEGDKAYDSNAKSNVDNVSRLVQACNAEEERDDFRECDSVAEIGDASLALDGTAATDAGSGDCTDPTDADTIATPAHVRIVTSGKKCFVVLGESDSGNRFWFVKHNDGSVARGCETPGVTGCPATGRWG